MDSVKRAKAKHLEIQMRAQKSQSHQKHPNKTLKVRYADAETPSCGNKRDADTTTYAIGTKCIPGGTNPCGTNTPLLATGTACDLTCYDVTDSGNYKCVFAIKGDLVNRNRKCTPEADGYWWLDDTCKESATQDNKYKCQYSNGDWKCKCGGPNEPCCQGETPGSMPKMAISGVPGNRTYNTVP